MGFILGSLFVFAFVNSCLALRPLVLIHGVTSAYTEFGTLESYVRADYPDIQIFSLNGGFNNEVSTLSLYEQIPVFSALLFNITSHYGDVTLLGYSQGGVLSRGVVQMSDNKNIHTFISLSAPALGEYGVPDLGPPLNMVNISREWVYKICYRDLGQSISVCNYWNDPTQRALYLKRNFYLPLLNNEVPHSSSERYKENFMSLEKLVLIGGPDDGVIIPWQSAHYAYYDADLNVVPFSDQQTYVEDSFGMRGLYEQGKVAILEMAGVDHGAWIESKAVYEQLIKPYLE